MKASLTDLIVSQAKKITFVYKKSEEDKKQRTIELGSEVIVPLLHGGESWGTSSKDGKVVSHKDKVYLQGVETDEEGNKRIKRFEVSKIEDLQILE